MARFRDKINWDWVAFVAIFATSIGFVYAYRAL